MPNVPPPTYSPRTHFKLNQPRSLFSLVVSSLILCYPTHRDYRKQFTSIAPHIATPKHLPCVSPQPSSSDVSSQQHTRSTFPPPAPLSVVPSPPPPHHPSPCPPPPLKENSPPNPPNNKSETTPSSTKTSWRVPKTDLAKSTTKSSRLE